MVFAARDQREASVFSGIPELAVRALGLDDAVEVLLSAAGEIPLDRQVARDIAARAASGPRPASSVARHSVPGADAMLAAASRSSWRVSSGTRRICDS